MKKILTACANEKKHQKKISKNPVFFKIAKIEKSQQDRLYDFEIFGSRFCSIMGGKVKK